ncbi:MAG: undecaprenyldiphospho-muramoylpentapeptide beta-N-acetylglucosaminyltransferase [Deltaproteobacteria bacterium]|nr:undecaprenyldiphospho-muramoylpentapeptide beta-N-acetylglucosaminyltransferase [Deltaproteobacteria bacterium]
MVIAGGGTGGHLFPGLATARELTRRHPEADILFVTGERRMETRILERSGYGQVSIRVQPLKGRGWAGGLAAVLALPGSMVHARRILKRFVPRAVLGVGGYSSGPVCLAARTLGIPTAIHEQNSFPGLTNRLLCRIVDRVFISFEESRTRFPAGRVVLTGNPVREEILRIEPRRIDPERPLSVLVVGGSQGARAVNTAVADALVLMKARGAAVRVVHQTGDADYDRVLGLYTDRGLRGVVKPFIEEMAEAYAQADLVVGRAGASTVTELAALGKPSILIPFPHAANNHQVTNARALADAGGSVLLLQADLDGSTLADLLTRYAMDREPLRRMSVRAREKARPEAARTIVNQIEALMRLGSGRRSGS